jgi:aspartate aminotransferase
LHELETSSGAFAVSRRAHRLPASPIRKLAPLAEAAKARGTKVYHLNIGQPDIETPEVMRRRLRDVPPILAYTPSGGTPEFVRSLLGYYRSLGVALEADQLVTTTGGSEAIQFAMLACADTGGEVILPEPFYTNYAAFARIGGLDLVPVTTRGDDGFHLPPRDVFERAITPRTRLVVLCNPNNPTGTAYTPAEVTMLAELCKDRGLFLVVDEVYRELVYDGRKPTTALTLSGFDDNIVVVDSLSKRYSACGIRLGAIVSRNRALVDACLRMAQGRLSAPGLAQLVGTGMEDLGPEYTAGVVREYEGRRNLLYDALSSIPGVFVRKPEGAFYFVVRLPVADGEAFARFLLSEYSQDGATVMVAPAEGFYATPGLGRNEVRIAYVLNQDDLRAAVRVLAGGLSAYAARSGGSPASREAAVSRG